MCLYADLCFCVEVFVCLFEGILYGSACLWVFVNASCVGVLVFVLGCILAGVLVCFSVLIF